MNLQQMPPSFPTADREPTQHSDGGNRADDPFRTTRGKVTTVKTLKALAALPLAGVLLVACGGTEQATPPSQDAVQEVEAVEQAPEEEVIAAVGGGGLYDGPFIYHAVSFENAGENEDALRAYADLTFLLKNSEALRTDRTDSEAILTDLVGDRVTANGLRDLVAIADKAQVQDQGAIGTSGYESTALNWGVTEERQGKDGINILDGVRSLDVAAPYLSEALIPLECSTKNFDCFRGLYVDLLDAEVTEDGVKLTVEEQAVHQGSAGKKKNFFSLRGVFAEVTMVQDDQGTYLLDAISPTEFAYSIFQFKKNEFFVQDGFDAIEDRFADVEEIPAS